MGRDCKATSANLTQEVVERICSSRALPAVPEVAVKTITLCKNPDVDLSKLASFVSSDTALAAKLLQLANSSFYASQNRVKTIRGALVRLGLKVSRIAVLGFSLAAETERKSASLFDIQRFWRYALTTAGAARLIAEAVMPAKKDEAFACGLMQDVGVLAFQCVMPEEYSEVLAAQRADPTMELSEIEAVKLGATHMEIGSRLLRRWRLPAEMYEPISDHHCSDETESDDPRAKVSQMTWILRLGATIARLFNDPAKGITHEMVMKMAQERFGLSRKGVVRILERVESTVRETAKLFQIDPASTASYEEIKAQAAYEIARLSADMEHEIQDLRTKAEQIELRARELEEDKVELSRRLAFDELTGVLSRPELLKRLESELSTIRTHGGSISLLFMDIDKFKSVNDNHGHGGGDVVLKSLGEFLNQKTRQQDAVARYGGDEFLMMLPGADLESAMKIAERLRISVAEASKEWLSGLGGVTLSVGLFCASAGPEINSKLFLRQANTCFYAAKAAGGNCTRYNAA